MAQNVHCELVLISLLLVESVDTKYSFYHIYSCIFSLNKVWIFYFLLLRKATNVDLWSACLCLLVSRIGNYLVFSAIQLLLLPAKAWLKFPWMLLPNSNYLMCLTALFEEYLLKLILTFLLIQKNFELWSMLVCELISNFFFFSKLH